MNKISVIVIPQGAPLILPLLCFASSLFYFSKPTLPEPLFLPKKIRKSLPHVSHFFLLVLSLFAFLPLSYLYFLLLQSPLFFFSAFSFFKSECFCSNPLPLPFQTFPLRLPLQLPMQLQFPTASSRNTHPPFLSKKSFFYCSFLCFKNNNF